MVFPKLTHSKLRQKVLGYFFINPQAAPYLREIAAVIKVDPGNLSKELLRLEKDGVFVSNMRGKQKYYSINRKYPLFKELRSVVLKTIGIESRLKDVLCDLEGVDAAFIYGSLASRSMTVDSDIDVMVIGRVDEDLFAERFDRLEKESGREINYNIYTKEEFVKRLKRKDSFIDNVLARKKIMLKGHVDDIR